MTSRTAWWWCLLICCFSGIASREDACMQPSGFSASSSSCSKYFYCDSLGVSQEGECEKGKFWNKDLELCDWEENVTCGKGFLWSFKRVSSFFKVGLNLLSIASSVIDNLVDPAPAPEPVTEPISESNGTIKDGMDEAQKCDTAACKRNAERAEYLMDYSVDPCEDFFQFACSSKNRGQKFPFAREAVTSNLTELVVKASGEFLFLNKFYQSCVSITTQFSTPEVAEYCLQDDECNKEELGKFGSIYLEFQRYVKHFANETSWPVLTENWENKSKNFFDKEGFSWHKLSENILKQEYYLGAFQYVSLSVCQNDDDATQTETFFSNVFFAPMIDHSIKQSVLVEKGLEQEKYTSKIHIIPMTFPKFLIETNLDQEAKYRKIMTSVMKLLGADDIIAETDMNKVLENEKKLAKFTKYEYMDNTDTKFEEVTLEEMNDLLPDLNWTDYVNTVLNNPNVTVNGSEKVLIPGKEVLKNIYNEINKMSDREQANILLWRMFAKFAANFLKTGNENEAIHENIFDRQGLSTSRSENCVNQIKTFFPNILDDLTISHYLQPEEKENIIQMFEEIKDEFSDIIDQSEWMQNETKVEAHKKLSKMEINVGKMHSNFEHLSDTLNQIKVDDYIGNIRKLGNSFWTKRVQGLQIPKDPFICEAVDNAFYWGIFNQIQINVGLIKGSGVGITEDLPRAVLYGGFTASTLGHELTHGFDDSESQFDGNGERRNWWDPQSKEEFEKKTECLVDQYNNFTFAINGTEYNVDGNATLGENIADNGGIKIGYRAFLKANAKEKEILPRSLNLTPRQLFWIGYAHNYCLLGGLYEYYGDFTDVLSYWGGSHAPGPWRVNTVMSNQKEFAEDFNCPVGAKLNPVKKCVVW